MARMIRVAKSVEVVVDFFIDNLWTFKTKFVFPYVLFYMNCYTYVLHPFILIFTTIRTVPFLCNQQGFSTFFKHCTPLFKI